MCGLVICLLEMEYKHKGFFSYVFDLALHNTCLQGLYRDVSASPEISPT